MNKLYKFSDSVEGVIRPKTPLNKKRNDKTDKTKKERCVEGDVVVKTGLMVDAVDLMMKRKEDSAVITKSLLGMKFSEEHQKEALPNAGPLGILPVARAGRSMLPSSDASTDNVMKAKNGKKKENSLLVVVGVRTPKPTGNHLEAAESKSKPGGGDNDEADNFVNENGRRKTIDEEEASRYSIIANDN